MNSRQRRRQRRKDMYSHSVAAVFRSAWHAMRNAMRKAR